MAAAKRATSVWPLPQEPASSTRYISGSIMLFSKRTKEKSQLDLLTEHPLVHCRVYSSPSGLRSDSSSSWFHSTGICFVLLKHPVSSSRLHALSAGLHSLLRSSGMEKITVLSELILHFVLGRKDEVSVPPTPPSSPSWCCGCGSGSSPGEGSSEGAGSSQTRSPCSGHLAAAAPSVAAQDLAPVVKGMLVWRSK